MFEVKGHTRRAGHTGSYLPIVKNPSVLQLSLSAGLRCTSWYSEAER